MKNNILLIDDDTAVREIIASLLTEEGFSVRSADSACKAKKMVCETAFDAILLDISLPDGNGLDLIEAFRSLSDAPIIIISGRTDTIDKVVGLDMGADDYIAKPLQLKEMTARINAQLRRHKQLSYRPNANRIAFDDYVLDRAQMQVFDLAGISMHLTARECKLLETFVMAPKQVHTREQLLNKVRADNLDVTDRAVDVQLLRIRKKLHDTAKDPRIFKSVRGVGYMLNCTPTPLEHN